MGISIVLTGGAGRFARQLQMMHSAGECFAGQELWAPARDELDIGEEDCIDVIRKANPELIINAASFSRVDDAESEPELAFRDNAEGPSFLAYAARKLDIPLLHISTDYVFDGDTDAPYGEEDQTNPIGLYGQSKLEGELRIRHEWKKHLILRVQWLYGDARGEFIDYAFNAAAKGNAINAVQEQVGAPSYNRDLIHASENLLRKGCLGTYHIANRGSTTRYDHTLWMFEQCGVEADVRKTTWAALNRPAARPKHSVLAVDKYEKDCGATMRHWQAALLDHLGRTGRYRP